MPVLHTTLNLIVVKNFTLAPFITVFSYQNNIIGEIRIIRIGIINYRQTVIPIGVKGSYYFDQILKAGHKWDFYLAAFFGSCYTENNLGKRILR